MLTNPALGEQSQPYENISQNSHSILERNSSHNVNHPRLEIVGMRLLCNIIDFNRYFSKFADSYSRLSNREAKGEPLVEFEVSVYCLFVPRQYF